MNIGRIWNPPLLLNMTLPHSTSTAPLRPADKIMKLARMGSFHQTRLSFMRSLLRNLYANGWEFERTRWQVDNNGVGYAVYRASRQSRIYSLICFAHDLPEAMRSDRVIATAWDATFTLFDGVPSQQDIARLQVQVAKQEAGHCTQTELVLARANRSVRLFEHVVERLSAGVQPDQLRIDEVGYLMRTTAVYGNGKFGISDRERIADRAEFASAFHTELLAVWLIRWFTVDIAEHLAKVRGGDAAVSMDADLRRRIGVGNSTGLGMAPFLILHPALIHSWMLSRETALARVRAIPLCSAQTHALFAELVARMRLGVEHWHTRHCGQQDKNACLKKDLCALAQYHQRLGLEAAYPWDQLVRWSENTCGLEGQELLVTLVIEPHGAWVDDLSVCMSVDESKYFSIDGAMTVLEALDIIKNHYAWALSIDYAVQSESARFWYYSEEKLEPRVGERFEEAGADKEHPLCYGRDVSLLARDMRAFLARENEGDNSGDNRHGRIATFLLKHPQHRHAVRRIQIAASLEYAEIQDNLISAAMMPLDLLRCKLSFFGASKFDPRSDRWVRINMYQHAPFPDEMQQCYKDDWVYPPLPAL